MFLGYWSIAINQESLKIMISTLLKNPRQKAYFSPWGYYPAIYASSVFWISVVLFTSCASSAKQARLAYDSGGLAQLEDQPKASDYGEEPGIFLEDRQVSYTYTLQLQVKSDDSLLAKITSILESYDGYVQASDKYHVVLKVASQRASDFMERLATLGKIKNKEIRSEDVSLQAKDFSIRLENAQKTRDRYLELLQIAQTVDEILKIERELERLNTNIDLLKGQLAALQSRVSLSEINIRIQKRVKPGPLGYVFVGLYEGIKWIFVRD